MHMWCVNLHSSNHVAENTVIWVVHGEGCVQMWRANYHSKHHVAGSAIMYMCVCAHACVQVAG